MSSHLIVIKSSDCHRKNKHYKILCTAGKTPILYLQYPISSVEFVAIRTFKLNFILCRFSFNALEKKIILHKLI